MPELDNTQVGNLADQVKRLMERTGGAESAIRQLLRENQRYRERHRTDTEQIDDLKKKLPGEGTIVLAKDSAELKAYTDFQALKLTPTQVGELQTKVTTLTTQIAERDEADLIRSAASAVGYKAGVLADLRKAKGLTLEMRDTEVPDKDDSSKKTVVKLPHVKVGDKVELLTAYVERDLKDYVPALKADTAQPHGDELVFPEMRVSGGHKGGNGSDARKFDPVGRATSMYQTPGERAKQSATT